MALLISPLLTAAIASKSIDASSASHLYIDDIIFVSFFGVTGVYLILRKDKQVLACCCKQSNQPKEACAY